VFQNIKTQYIFITVTVHSCLGSLSHAEEGWEDIQHTTMKYIYGKSAVTKCILNIVTDSSIYKN